MCFAAWFYALDINRTIVRVVRWLFLLAASSCTRPDVDTAAANMPTDETCEFVRIAAHNDPTRLIDEFVARDARGEFTESSAWFNGAVDCPGHEPGPDQAAVVATHAVRVLTRDQDSVLAEVTWRRLGYVTGGVERAAPGVDIDTLRAIRTPFGWRIESPALNPHVPGPAASRPDA